MQKTKGIHHWGKVTGMLRALSCLIVFILPTSLLLLPCLYAAFEDDAAGARMRAMGGTYVSLADDNQSVFGQPAGMANIKDMEMALSYGRLFAGLSDGSAISDALFSFAAPVKGKWSAGAGYKKLQLDAVYSEETLVADAAYKWNSIASAGLGIKYMRLSYGSDDYTRRDPLFQSGYQKAGIDLDIGLFARPLPFLGVAYTRQNILGATVGLRENTPAALHERIGVSYREEHFLAALENIRTGNQNMLALGAEKSLLGEVLALRFGCALAAGEFRTVTTGFGIRYAQYVFDYSWEYPITGIEKTSGSHHMTFSAKVGKAAVRRKIVFPVLRPAQEDRSTVQLYEYTTPLDMNMQISTAIAGVREDAGVTAEEPEAATQLMVLYSTPPAAAKRALQKKKLMLPGLIASSALAGATTVHAVTGGEQQVFSSGTVVSDPAVSQEAQQEQTAADMPAPMEEQPRVTKKKKSPVIEEGEEEEVRQKPLRQEPRPAVRTHKVDLYDTLPGLAEKYYGNKAKWADIYEANKDKIEKGSLRPGQVLVIP